VGEEGQEDADPAPDGDVIDGESGQL
jgi:hypothetical protein